MKNSLAKSGLSLSQASSISNMCFQRAQEIDRKIRGVNNFSKTIKISGEVYTETAGKEIPANIVELLLEKSKLHACQAFLMENIKLKDSMLLNLKNKRFVPEINSPEEPNYVSAKLQIPIEGSKEQVAAWAREQLSIAEICEFLEEETYAAHLGQFIHKEGPLSSLREELPNIKGLDWKEVEVGKKTPMIVKVHHTSEQLLTLHEKLALMHREHEMKVNRLKAKMTNLVTEENARVASENGKEEARVNKINSDLRKEYELAYKTYTGEIQKAKQDFENQRQLEIQTTAALRISVDKRFQEVVDLYMPKGE